MRIRAKILVEGKVQIVGYRDAVRDIAKKIGLVGYVRNLKDGNVEIICEGEKNDIDKFTKRIRIKDDFISVDKVTITKRNKPKGDFKHFEIRRGAKWDEDGMRMDTGIFLMKGLYGKMKGVKEETRGTREEVKASRNDIQKVGNGVRLMHTDVTDRLSDVDNHLIGIDSKLGTVIERYDTFSIEMKELKNSMKKIEEQFTRLVDHFIKSGSE